MTRLILLTILTSLMGACAHRGAAPTASQTPPAAKAFDLPAHLAREATGLSSRAVAAPDQTFATAVDAAAPPEVTLASPGTWSILIPIGTTSPISCALRTDNRIDAADPLRKLVREPAAKFPKFGVEKMDAGVIAHAPYLALEMFYVTVDKHVGLVKGMTVAFSDETLICVHDELGYSKTLRRAVEQLTHAMRFSRPRYPLRFQQVNVARVGDLVVGYEQHLTLIARDGATKEIHYGAGFFPVPGENKDVQFFDAMDISTLDAKGAIQNLTSTLGENGALRHKLTVAVRGKNEYEVTGQKRGQSVSSRFTLSQPLLGMARASYLRAEHNRAKKTTPLHFATCDLSDDPPASVRAYERLPESTPERSIYLWTDGTKRTRSEYNAQGIAVRVQLTHVTLDTVSLDGTP